MFSTCEKGKKGNMQDIMALKRNGMLVKRIHFACESLLPLGHATPPLSLDDGKYTGTQCSGHYTWVKTSHTFVQEQ